MITKINVKNTTFINVKYAVLNIESESKPLKLTESIDISINFKSWKVLTIYFALYWLVTKGSDVDSAKIKVSSTVFSTAKLAVLKVCHSKIWQWKLLFKKTMRFVKDQSQQ